MKSVKDPHRKANISPPDAVSSASPAESALPVGARPPRAKRRKKSFKTAGLSASPLVGSGGPAVRSVGPQFAVRSDGSLLLSREDIPSNADLGGRPVWSGLVLTPRDARHILAQFAHADADVASRFIMGLPRKRSKK